MMAGMTGVELCEQLRRQHPELKFLMMSGYPRRIGRPEFVLPDNAVFLAMPFQSVDLLKKLHELVSCEEDVPYGVAAGDHHSHRL